MLSPVSLLSVFCGVMVALSIGRLVRADERDRVDAGTVVLLLGITALSLLWTAIEHAVAVPGVQLTLGVVGTGLTGLGLALVARYWDTA